LNSLLVGILTGAVGMAFFVYGKRQTKFVPILAGLALCIYPYFVDSLLWLCLVGLLLVALPFLIDW